MEYVRIPPFCCRYRDIAWDLRLRALDVQRWCQAEQGLLAYVVSRTFHCHRSGYIQRGRLGSFADIYVRVLAIFDIYRVVLFKESSMDALLV